MNKLNLTSAILLASSVSFNAQAADQGLEKEL